MKKRKFKFFVKHPLITLTFKILLKIILFLLSLYLLLGTLLFFNTDKFVYHPTDDDFYSCNFFNEFTKEEINGTRFYYRDAVDPNTVLVYYHGNGGSACDRYYLPSGFQRIGVRQIFVEYSGYANDSRKPSKELLLNDVRNIQSFIDKKNIKNVAVVGESLGSALASYHSTLTDKVYSVVLVAPFDSIESVATNGYLKYYPKSIYNYDNYDNIEYLENYSKKLIIIHGKLDENIPIFHSEVLFNSSISNDKLFVKINNASHKNLYNNFDTFRAIRLGVENDSLSNFVKIYN